MQDSGVQSFVQQSARMTGFTPATYPLDYTDFTPPSSLTDLLDELVLGGLAGSASVASAPDFLAEFVNQASAFDMDLLGIATLGVF
jgi:hypothetical protein